MSIGSVEISTFQEYELARGMRALVAPTPKFKRTHVMVAVHDRLDPARTSLGALLPYVQKRGTAKYPTGMDLERAAGALYDASLSGGVYKVGDRQLITYSLDIAADRYVGQPILREGLDLLAEMVTRPAVEGSGSAAGFCSDYVEQEKRFQVGRLRALVNNKIAYARHRCIEEMFKGEPYAQHELGDEEGIRTADPAGLLAHHRSLLSTRPVDVYVVGDVDTEGVVAEIREAFTLPREEVEAVPVTRVQRGEGEPREVVQEEQMNQGWLVLGLRTDISRSDEDRHALSFFNGILGGFVHSKLFVNVREKASLAYTASSSYDANKGLLIAIAGIDVNKYQQALDIMKVQIDDCVAGRFSDEDMEATRLALCTQYRMRLDSPSGRILYHVGGTAEGRPETIEETIEAIERVGRDDVVRAGERLRLDTVYFLKGVGA